MVRIYYLVVSLLVVCTPMSGEVTSGSSANNPIDGWYGALPRDASEAATLAQDLGGLLLHDEAFKNVKIVGRLDKIRLSLKDDLLVVAAYDTTGKLVIERNLQVRAEMWNGASSLTWTSEWEDQHEGAYVKGSNAYRMMRDASGNLLVNLEVNSRRVGWFSKSKPEKSEGWMKYPALKVNPTSQPKHDEGQRAKGE